MWLWTAIDYHALFFAEHQQGGVLFAALFVVQGGYLFYEGCYRGRIHFTIRSGLLAWLGLVFAAYAAILYPLIGMMSGHPYRAMPMFGVTPCPVTIFTFGMLLATVPPLSRWLLVDSLCLVADRGQRSHTAPCAAGLVPARERPDRRTVDCVPTPDRLSSRSRPATPAPPARACRRRRRPRSAAWRGGC